MAGVDKALGEPRCCAAFEGEEEDTRVGRLAAEGCCMYRLELSDGCSLGALDASGKSVRA